jgi:hypothetical protein
MKNQFYIIPILILILSGITCSNDQEKDKHNNYINIDTTPPKLLNLIAEPDLIKAGESIKIKTKFKEEGTGIDYLSIDLYSPNKIDPNIRKNNLSIRMNLSYNKKENLFIGDKIMEDYLPSGTWAVGDIYVKDRAGNVAYYKMDNLSNKYEMVVGDMDYLTDIDIVYFDITNSQTDTQAPKVKNIHLMNDMIKTSGKIKIRGEASDDYSGVNTFRVIFYSPTRLETGKSDGKDIYFFLDKKDTGYWEDEKDINHYIESGLWIAKEIYISDRAGNFRQYKIIDVYNNKDTVYYYEQGKKTDIPMLKIQIKDTFFDNTPPTLMSISLNPRKIKNRGKINIEARAKEKGSTVRGIVVTFYSPSKLKYGREKGVEVYGYLDFNYKREIWEGFIEIESYHEKGIWKAGSINVYDDAENRTIYRIDYPSNDEYYKTFNNLDNKRAISNIKILSFKKE